MTSSSTAALDDPRIAASLLAFEGVDEDRRSQQAQRALPQELYRKLKPESSAEGLWNRQVSATTSAEMHYYESIGIWLQEERLRRSSEDNWWESKRKQKKKKKKLNNAKNKNETPPTPPTAANVCQATLMGPPG